MNIKVFIACLFLANLVAAQQIESLDGKIDDSETFDEVVTNEAYKLMVRHSENYIYVNIKSEELLVVSLCISQGNEVKILHASAALGAISYHQNNNQWTTSEKFDWQMRETAMDQATISKRNSYLQTNGWVANTMKMGVAGENEFIISTNLIQNKESFQLAAGLMPAETPDKIISIPKGLEAGCANALLVSGDPNPNYDFLTRGWYRIELEP